MKDKKRHIFLSDIHGCRQEMDELLKKVEYNKETDQLIFGGDYYDRGPDNIGTIRRVRELVYDGGALSIRGNHEQFHLRWYKGDQNPGWLKTRPHYAEFNDEDITFINNLPLYVEVKSNLYAIHAGVKPNLPIEKQRKEDLLYLRYTDAERKPISLKKVANKTSETKPIFWTEFGPFNFNVVYGHQVYMDGYKIDKFDDGTFTIGIDGGCCFGGSLNALVIKDDNSQEIVQVKAKQAYYNSHF